MENVKKEPWSSPVLRGSHSHTIILLVPNGLDDDVGVTQEKAFILLTIEPPTPRLEASRR
jgi:hypothetical protein